MSEPSPAVGHPLSLSPGAVVKTNLQTLVAIVVATAVTVGGLISVKADIAMAMKVAGDATKEASDARRVAEEIRAELYRLRLDLGVFANANASNPRNKQP